MEDKRIICGLDVSTACIGIAIIEDDGDKYPKILDLTQIVPKISKKISGIEGLFLKKNKFENDFLPNIKDLGITDVVIEEPLLRASGSIDSVAALLRFNGLISESIYRILGIIPSFISSYDARKYSFPDLMSIRNFNKQGERYKNSKILKDIKDQHLVLFGDYPYDIDKKLIMWNKVNEVYKDITWIYNKKGELRKENFDACDALVCGIAYVNIYKNGKEEPQIINVDTQPSVCNYTIKIWDKLYNKKISL